MAWIEPKTDWNATDQGIANTDLNRIEGNIDFLSKSGGVVDADGNVYPSVVIDGIQWTTKNFACTKLADGTAIAEVTDQTAWNALTTPAYCKYSNEVTLHGLLYNYETIDPQGAFELAPEGWRVATVTDWTTMLTYLGANGYTYDRSTGGLLGAKLAMSAADVPTWTFSGGAPYGVPNAYPYENNSSGLSLRGGGYRTTSFTAIGQDGRYWAPFTTPGAPTNYLQIGHNDLDIDADNQGIANASGLSVRMVRDV